MSISLRLVQEVWGQSTSSFLDTSNILQALQTVADRVEGRYEVTSYGEVNHPSLKGGACASKPEVDQTKR